MRLSKREKLLVALLGVLALAAVGFLLLIRPQMTALQRARLEREQVATERLQMESLLTGSSLDAEYEAQRSSAQRNYDVFYSKLNGYTIDKILSDLIAQRNLTPSRMAIGDYEALPGEAETPAAEQLLTCQVTLTVSGSQADLQAFLDDLNAASFCLQAQAIQMEDDPAAVGGTVRQATFSLVIYGVQAPQLASQE
jgi:Tfp pilus assembly protein PilO